MSLADKLAAAWPAHSWRDCHVLVAVSGGADSVALLRALAEITRQDPGRGRLVVSHYNHRLRDEADHDAAWVEAVAAELGLACVVGRADAAGELASEQAAREARYAFLCAEAERLGARFVATAHTADDQVETVLMRVLRGSGIDGLAGIPFARPLSASVTVVRPLLAVRRAEVEHALAELGQDHRTDQTNFESQFTRNWIRHELLPSVRDRLAGDPDGAILRLAQQADEWRGAMDQIADRLVSAAVVIDPRDPPRHMVIDCSVLASEPAMVAQQACRHAWRLAGWPEQAMGMTDWQRLAAAVRDPQTAGFTLPGGIEVRRDATHVVLALGDS